MAQVSQQVVEGFLKELLGAKKAAKLYPATNPLATEWVQRLHRSLEAALKDGLPSPLRIGPGRFEWDGGQLATRDAALEAFRFELETRRITEIAFEPGIEPSELRELLDCLNLAYQDIEEAGGLAALLERRNVTHIVLRGPRWGEAGGSGTPDAPGASTPSLEVVEALVRAILESLAAHFRELTYDRRRLSGWLIELAQPGDRADVIYAAIQTLIPLIDAEPDREIRYRTLAESIVSLPDPLRATVMAGWIMPGVRTDLNLLNLLTRFSGDEFAELTGLIAPGMLEALRADIEALPTEEWKKARLIEGLEDALAEKEVAATPIEALIRDDDPGLLSLRAAALATATPARVLEHSVSVLFQLFAATESDAYPVFLVDALEEGITEALGRDQLALALRVLRSLAEPADLHPEWLTEHQRRVQILQRRLAARSQVALLGDLLRRREDADDVASGAEYLRRLGQEAIAEFVGILVDEPEGAARARMLDTLAALGPAAAPAMREWVGDGRWLVARSMIGLLVRIGDRAAFEVVEKAAKHEHPQVRREVARALPVLGGKQAMKPLLDYLSDPDGDVRLTATKLLGTLIDAEAVGPLRAFLQTPTRSVQDLLVKRQIITALASIATPEARAVLEGIAHRRLWPWQRNEVKLRQLADEAVTSMGQPVAAARDA